jgi:4,5-dihydroxyphthalate decarboxylase
MANLNLSFAITPYDRILPLINGEVRPDGINLEYAGMPGGVPRVFYEQMKFQRYDLSEMSMSSYLRMRSIRWPYYMLPVFHNRNFSYTHIRIRKNSGIRPGHPEDLKGKRIGIGDYQQSLGLWTRGILKMEWGLKPEDMVWYQERGQHFSHTGAARDAGLNIPPQVKLYFAQKDFGAMYREGELDANCGLGPGTGLEHGLLDRRRDDISVNEVVAPLFPDSKQEAIRFFRKTGIFPPHHTTVIRESIVQDHPWVSISLMEAFEESKRIAMQRLRHNPPGLLVFGLNYLQEVEEVFGLDPFVYGIKSNTKVFDTAQEFSLQQGLTERKQPWDEIFPQEVIYMEEKNQ